MTVEVRGCFKMTICVFITHRDAVLPVQPECNKRADIVFHTVFAADGRCLVNIVAVGYTDAAFRSELIFDGWRDHIAPVNTPLCFGSQNKFVVCCCGEEFSFPRDRLNG